MGSVDHREGPGEQVCAETATLRALLDAEPRQIPVGLDRVGAAHLLQRCVHVLMLGLGDCRGQVFDDGLFVRRNSRR